MSSQNFFQALYNFVLNCSEGRLSHYSRMSNGKVSLE